MFQFAVSFNSDLSFWNVKNVEQAGWTFRGARSFNRDVSNWDLSNCDTVRKMFAGATEFNQNLCDWGARFDDGSVVVQGMFAGTSCNIQDGPDPFDVPEGPFCQAC